MSFEHRVLGPLILSQHLPDLLAPLLLYVFETWRPNALIMTVGFSIAFVALALYMLPRIKGVFVGLQWAKRMHGFGKQTVQSPAE